MSYVKDDYIWTINLSLRLTVSLMLLELKGNYTGPACQNESGFKHARDADFADRSLGSHPPCGTITVGL